jgi:hypothetical protein
MKWRTGCALLGLVVAAAVASGAGIADPPARPAQGKQDLEKTLIGLEKQSWVAWKARDGAFFQDFLSDDHIEVGTGGPASKADVVVFVGSPQCVVKSYSVSDFRLTVVGADTALLTYRAEQDTACGGAAVPSPAWASSLYARRNGRWLNVLYQQTPVVRR